MTLEVQRAIDVFRADALAIVRRTGLIVNGSNAWRVDSLPFGGLGNSGLGRAEVRFMVEELTQRKALVIRRRKGRQR